MTAFVEPADLVVLHPPMYFAKHIEILTAEAVVLFVAGNASRAEMGLNRGFDLSQ